MKKHYAPLWREAREEHVEVKMLKHLIVGALLEG